jgi:steroid delta-isomerase-like uncharacterized protein
MSTEENKALSRRFWEEVFNGRNLDLIDEFCGPNFVLHGMSNQESNAEGLKQMLSMWFNAFPDIHVTIDDLFAEGDRCAVRWTWRGTHKGEMMGIPPTGKQVTAMGIDIEHIVGGKFVEVWTFEDEPYMMQQLGVVPSQ